MAASGGKETRKITPRLVVAIDIGTYASGYAFQFRNDFETNRLRIYANKNWSSRYRSFSTYKTPTCLLLKPDKTISDFGYEASQKYYRFKTKGAMKKPSDCYNYYYFRHFKMSLYHKKTITDETPIEAADEKHLPAIIVFSRTIEYLKSHMITHLRTSGLLKARTFKTSIKSEKTQTSRSLYDPDETRWVITVPALWGEPAKQLMKRAAIQAGISPERVIIALEPECAAIYCSQLPNNKLEIYQDKDDITYVASPGSNIMVVDIGGGTVDISTLTVCKDSKMKQIHKSGGGIWGGQRINEKILEMLVEIFGQEIMKEFAELHGNDENNLIIGIEREKRELKDSTNDEDVDENIGFQIDFPDSLRRLCEDKHSKREINAILKGKAVIFEAGQLIFQSDKIRQYFQETSHGIIKYLKEVLNDPLLNNIKLDAMLVVGGFAESNFLIECLRTGLADTKIPVVRPQESELSVLNGAVLFGHDETFIASRVMTHTIGIAMTMEFDPKKHDKKEAYVLNGKKFANNVFRKHVEVGQSVRLGEWVHSKEYYREDANKTKATIYIYSSDSKHPVHTTEVGCTRIGQFDVIFRETESVTKKMKFKQSVNVEFYFGGTELIVRAITKIDGETRTEYLVIV